MQLTRTISVKLKGQYIFFKITALKTSDVCFFVHFLLDTGFSDASDHIKHIRLFRFKNQ